MRRAGVVGGLLLALGPLRATQAQGAQVGSARLSVARSSDALACPDDELLAVRVRQLREGKADVPALLIDVQIDRHPSGYRARIRVNGPRNGERELRTEEDTCGGLADALSVSIAMLLHEEASPPDPQPPPEPPPPAPEPPVGRPFAILPLPPGAWTVSLSGGLALGVPSSALALLLSPGLHFLGMGLPWSFGGRFSWSPERRIAFAGGEVALSHWRVHLEACPRLLRRTTWMLSGCAEMAFGQLNGAGRGFTPDRETSRPYYAAGVSAWAVGEFAPRWLWSARATALAPFNRERFLVDQQGVAYQLPSLGGELTLGIVRRF